MARNSAREMKTESAGDYKQPALLLHTRCTHLSSSYPPLSPCPITHQVHGLGGDHSSSVRETGSLQVAMQALLDDMHHSPHARPFLFPVNHGMYFNNGFALVLSLEVVCDRGSAMKWVGRSTIALVEISAEERASEREREYIERVSEATRLRSAISASAVV